MLIFILYRIMFQMHIPICIYFSSSPQVAGQRLDSSMRGLDVNKSDTTIWFTLWLIKTKFF